MSNFYLRASPADIAKVVISVSKKVSKKAVVRNKIKRRVRAVIQKLDYKLKPAQYLIVAKLGAENVKGKELENELKLLIVKCKL